MRNIFGLIILSIFFSTVTIYAANEYSQIKGKVIRVELEPSKDPRSPTLWPCLLIDDRQIMLVGSPEILEELYNLENREVVLTAKKLPSQKYADKEYDCFEIGEIEKLYDQDYLSPRKAIKEFKDAVQKRGVVDDSGAYKDGGAIKSIWYDKNGNSIIDKDDKFFITSITTGESNGKHLIYPSQVVVRRYKNKKLYHHTFTLKDPLPNIYSSAIFGRLVYDAEKDVYSIMAEKIYKEGDGGFSAPVETEKTLVLGSNTLLKLFVGKMILVAGDKYDNLLWYGDNKVEIARRDGQFIATVTGIISTTSITQKPWVLSTVLLKDKRGQVYELRREGYISLWKDFIGKEVTIIGALRSMVFDREENKYRPAIEVLDIR